MIQIERGKIVAAEINGAIFDDCYSLLETFDDKLEFILDLVDHFLLLLVSVCLNENLDVQILDTLNIKGVENNQKPKHWAHQNHVKKVVFKLV